MYMPVWVIIVHNKSALKRDKPGNFAIIREIVSH